MLRPVLVACVAAVGVTASCDGKSECSASQEPVQSPAMLQVASSHLAQRTYDANGRTLTVNGEEVACWMIVYKNHEGQKQAEDLDVDGLGEDLTKMHIEVIHATKSQIEHFYDNPNVDTIDECTSEFEVMVHENHGKVELTGPQEIPYGIWNVFEDTIPPHYPPETIQVCVIDSGYQTSNPDLNDDAQNTDPSRSDQSQWQNDGCEHGTHVSGTIGATDNGEGVIGVYPPAKQLIVDVFGHGGHGCGWHYNSPLLTAMESCADKGAKIISMSLGGSGSSTTEQTGITNLWNTGVLILAAAGNGGPNAAKSYPASYNNVISVAATDSNDNLASFSQHNDKVDIAAPGVATKSTCDDAYCSKSGTSMATPHVAGVAAFIWNSHPNCSNTEIHAALINSARDKGPPGRDNGYGAGIVSAWGAMHYLSQHPCGSPQPPTPVPTPPTPPPPTPPPTAPVCQGGCGLLVTIQTDNYGTETGWSLHDPTGAEVEKSAQGSYTANAKFYKEICLYGAGTYQFTITDSYGDGMCCSYGSGSYELDLDGTVVASGGEFGSSEDKSFECTEGGTLMPTPGSTPMPSPGTISTPMPSPGTISTPMPSPGTISTPMPTPGSTPMPTPEGILPGPPGPPGPDGPPGPPGPVGPPR